MSREIDLRPFLTQVMAFYRWKRPIDGCFPAPEMFEQIGSSEREILKHMPKHPFRARGDLSAWIMRHTAAAVMRGRDAQDQDLATEITAQLLKDPNSSFKFKINLYNDSDSSYQVTFTEDLVLEAKSEVLEDGSGSGLGAELRGKVVAYSSEVAVEESCRMIREVIGALLALGLATNDWRWALGVEPHFELAGESALEEEEPPTPGELVDLVSRTYLAEYQGGPLDQARAARTTAHPRERVTRQLARLWQDNSVRAQEIRTACGLYARAQVATDPGVAVVNYSMCLEGLLLDGSVKDNVIARLTEAVAYRLGKSAADRQSWRKSTRSLYNVRSEYVHSGRIQADFEQQEGWANTAREALNREIEDF